MEIQAQENLKEEGYLKFVLLLEERGEILYLFKRQQNHTDYAPEDKDKFIGAGTATLLLPEMIKIRWQSDTFKDNPDFARDRPEDESEAEKVLEMIRGAIEKWINN